MALTIGTSFEVANIPSLGTKTIKNLTRSQVSELSVEQIRAFSSAQIAAIDASDFIDFSGDQVGSGQALCLSTCQRRDLITGKINEVTGVNRSDLGR